MCPSTEPDQKTTPYTPTAAPLFWVAYWDLIHCPGWWSKQRIRFGKVVLLVIMLFGLKVLDLALETENEQTSGEEWDKGPAGERDCPPADCCLQEKRFNAFYAVLGEKFCEHDRWFQANCVSSGFREFPS